MRNQLLYLTALALAPVASGQANPLAGPAQGFVYDAPSRSVRQVLGSFGSAALGPAALSHMDFASVAPQRTYGVGCAAGECFLFAGLGSEELQRETLPEQVGTPQAAAWSSDGATAVLFSRDEQWVRVLHISNDGGLLQAGPQWSVEPLGGQLASLAIGPDGQKLTIGIGGEHPGVFEVTASGSFVPVLEAENPVSLAFSINGATLYVLDAGKREVTEKNMIDGLARSWPVEAVTDAVALQPARDAAVVYVAGRKDRALFVYSNTNHELTGVVELSFAPSQLEPVGTGSYLLTSRAGADEVLWSYTPGRGVFFVPVTPATEEDTTGLPQRRKRR